MVTDQQVRRLLAMQNKYKYQYQAADAAGISSKTASKYLKNGNTPFNMCASCNGDLLQNACYPVAFAPGFFSLKCND